MKETEPLYKREATQIVEGYWLKEVRRAVICGCPQCRMEAYQSMDWFTFPKESNTDFKADIMRMVRSQIIEEKQQKVSEAKK